MLLLALALLLPHREIVVRPGSAVPTLAAALAQARPGDTITITAGIYRTANVTVRTSRLTIRGDGWPVLDGGRRDEILVIAADDVTVQGIALTGAGVTMTRDQAAIRVLEVRGCRILGDRIDDSFFGIYLQRAHGCRVAGNVIRGTGNDEAENGNGIHLWNATDATID